MSVFAFLGKKTFSVSRVTLTLLRFYVEYATKLHTHEHKNIKLKGTDFFEVPHNSTKLDT